MPRKELMSPMITALVCFAMAAVNAAVLSTKPERAGWNWAALVFCFGAGIAASVFGLKSPKDRIDQTSEQMATPVCTVQVPRHWLQPNTEQAFKALAALLVNTEVVRREASERTQS